ncbi:hypothetical protein EDC04DRAFT_2605785 [Pisolithus marmoratus]|nr:hypothetical protein EDC04DRAFT_2605785 [Pisolithus marmoratus]
MGTQGHGKGCDSAQGYLQGDISRCGGTRILSGGAYLQGDGIGGGVWKRVSGRDTGTQQRVWRCAVSKKNVKWGVAYLQGNAIGGWGVEIKWGGGAYLQGDDMGVRDTANVGGGYLQCDHVKGGVWTWVGVRDMAKDEYKHKKEVR